MSTINIYFGLDLSLNSTGITATIQNNTTQEIEKIAFVKLIFDDESNVNKKYKPNEITNVNQKTYTLTKNIQFNDYVCEDEENGIKEQILKTFKSLQCAQEIQKIMLQIIEMYGETIENIYVCIENYIMPKFKGKANLGDVSSLISLQAYVREFIIKLSIVKKLKIRISVPEPKTIKKFFTNNGSAEKNNMLQSFIDNFEGKKLLPSIIENKSASINDVIDSFALMCYIYKKINF